MSQLRTRPGGFYTSGGNNGERSNGREDCWRRMSDWRYVAPAGHEAANVVNNRTYQFCKHCKCRATGKVDFLINRSSSEHTFPYNRPSAVVNGIECYDSTPHALRQ